ncbi:MAG: sigma-70 family RNA polymerase sigma factor [Verrucomicrobiae bacterium]|nr:sigma-70 family RNA polymerase sigma factor [Verrucomicrobiae bacterium]
MNASDSELLQQFVRDGSDGAFTELVRRHVDLVYSAALRQVGLDAQTAEDVTQTVFTDLARKSRRLTRHPTLTGWLYSSTRLAAAQHRRAESRRLARETAAHAMSQLLSPDVSEPDWNSLRPVLDEAMHDLNEADREAVLLRFFERRPLADIGAQLGLSENTARMRVERALDKLHAALARRGITSTAAALSLALGAHAVGAAPVGLADRIGSAALAGGAGGGAGAASGKLMLVTLALLLGIGALMWTSRYGWNRTASTDADPEAVAAGLAASGPETVSLGAADPAGDDAHSAAAADAGAAIADSSAGSDEPALLLTFLTKDSGRPVPNVAVNYRGWEGTHFTKRRFVSTRLGEATVRVAPGTTRLDLISEAEGFADTRLRWVPERGDTIPTNYTVRLERAVLIGGTVVDPGNRPVAGARVDWNHLEDVSRQEGVESHEFGWIEVETDAEGRWQIHRIAESMLEKIHGGARHPDFQPADRVGYYGWPGRDDLARQLRARKHVFPLKASGVLQGVVVNEAEEPLANAKVSVGMQRSVGIRETRTDADGSFEVRGTGLGMTPVTAEADGYAAKTVQLNLSEVNARARLVLGPGSPLRLRIINRAGEPVPRASVWRNTTEPGPQGAGSVTTLPQAGFEGDSDEEGRVVWKNAPPGEHHFDIWARGYLRTYRAALSADGEEHVVTLQPALVLQGRVTDAGTGLSVPKFRLVLGGASRIAFNQHPRVQFAPFDRFSMDFTGGTYRHSVEEEVIAGTSDPRCVVKFEAAGYLPYLSRPLRYDEGVVTLDVPLEKASEIEVTVMDPAGRAAPGADVGLVFPDAGLALGAGRITLHPFKSTGALKQADANGRLRLMNDPQVTRLIVAHPTGFLETSFAALEADGFARLQPWGRIEGEFLGTPGSLAGKTVRVSPWQRLSGERDLQYDLTALTDDSGRFLFPRVPPGHLRVGHWIVSDQGGTLTAGQSAEATVAPGETARVTLGGGYRVTGRLRLPAGFTAPPGAKWMAFLHTPLPDPTAEIRNDPAAVQQWLQTPEMQELVRRVKQLPVALESDGTFAADSVGEGDYRLSIALTPPLKPQMENPQTAVTPLLIAKGELTVPAEPATGEISLGEIAAEVPAETPGL